MTWSNNAVESITVGNPQGAHVYMGPDNGGVVGNDGVFLYDGGGNLTASLNTINGSLTFPSSVANAGYIIGGNTTLSVVPPNNGISTDGGTVAMNGDAVTTSRLRADGSLALLQAGGRFQYGAGRPGGYYYQEFTIPNGLVCNNAATTTLSGLTIGNSLTDYGTPLSGGNTWTCPADGVYTFTFLLYFGQVFNNNAHMNLSIVRSTTGYLYLLGNYAFGNGDHCLTGTKYISAGNTLNFQVYQDYGANLGVLSTGNIYSYIGIYRNP